MHRASRSLKFVTHQSLSIPIFLDSACAGVSCPEGKTCGAGGSCIGDDVVVVDAGTAVDAGTKPLVATSLFAGGDRICADTKSGFYCWGAGFGATPVRVAELDGSVSLALGKNHYCAVGVKGGLTCFGANDTGQLGTSTPLATKNEVPVPDLVDRWREVSVGSEHTCALGDSAKYGKVVVACWGGQSEGQVDGVVTKVVAAPRVHSRYGRARFLRRPKLIGPTWQSARERIHRRSVRRRVKGVTDGPTPRDQRREST
ncbi:hypothetical protein BH09MYX1_BH09MYX1_05840 [soil metagenome]